MPKTKFKITKLITSRLLFLFIGLFLSIAVITVLAAWNDPVSNNEPLTTTLWNDVVGKLVELDGLVNKCGGNLFVTGNGACRSASDIVTSVSGGVISCSWSGWRNSYEGIHCNNSCDQNGAALRFYCDNNVVTQVQTATVCTHCFNGP